MQGSTLHQHVRKWRQTSLGSVIVACALTVLCSSVLDAGSANASTRGLALHGHSHAVVSLSDHYPIGIFDPGEPSRFAPPAKTALPGYRRSYRDDFNVQLSPRTWFYFSGVPKGDPSGRFAPDHVAVDHGMLKIGTWHDPRFKGHWVSGGAGLDGVPTYYGAYFVRSRETAPGPDTVELLWPKDNQWPPEIDFAEAGEAPRSQRWFVHYNNAQDQVYGSTTIDIERWHTWGVIWTPNSITFTVDGRTWGKVTTSKVIPNIPMILDIQSQSWCGIAGEPCPTQDSTLLVDWVAVYTPA